MKKQNLILSAALAAVFSASTAFAEAEVTGKIVHESAKFTTSGTTIGAAAAHDKDVFKTETSARIYIDGEAEAMHEGATYHVELNLMRDSKGVGDYDSNESYTQRDALREAYVDMETNGYSIRAGKQQVVWGTADGMKLLDAINPTDYAEMAQNQMEDSRIPVWMLNAETDAADGGNWQFIISEGKSSNFAGMGNSSSTAKGTIALDGNASTKIFTEHTNNDRGNAFIMKGVDTITGTQNGFLNVAPALGAVSQSFDRGTATQAGAYYSLRNYTKATVNEFATNFNNSGAKNNQSYGFAGFCNNSDTTVTGYVSDGTGATCLSEVANSATAPNGLSRAANNKSAQNLISTQTDAEWTANLDNPTQMFHYMPDATFATFDAFVNMKSKYVVDHAKKATTALRYKNSTPAGLNYSMNVIHGNDTNPYVNMEWQDTNGVVLTETRSAATDDNSGRSYVTNLLTIGGTGTYNEVGGGTVADTDGDGTLTTAGAAGDAGTATDVAVLVMTEKLNSMTQIGGSFDTAIETTSLGPIVLRGEALYQKDVMSPVVTRKATNGVDLNHGFLVNAVKMEKGDRFKYVLGADITAMTNMMVSVQFIQDRNLDFYDVGNKDAADWKYTADMATMSLTNNLNKAEENKEFYSLFFSKPFGASGEHRWNNIFMFEENGGKWNRLDAEFSIDDDTQVTAEYNKYWGDANTQFGQLEASSNVQVGFKYSF